MPDAPPPQAHPPYLQSRVDGVVVTIKLQPRASTEEISGVQARELRIKVKAPPVDSAANDALIRFLAKTLDCPRSAIQLVRGQTSRHKQVLVRNQSIDDLARKLAAWVP